MLCLLTARIPKFPGPHIMFFALSCTLSSRRTYVKCESVRRLPCNAPAIVILDQNRIPDASVLSRAANDASAARKSHQLESKQPHVCVKRSVEALA